MVVFQVSVVIAISGWMEEDQDYRRSFGVLPDNEHISTEVLYGALTASTIYRWNHVQYVPIILSMIIGIYYFMSSSLYSLEI